MKTEDIKNLAAAYQEIVAEAIKLRIEYLFVEDESQNVLTQIPKSLEYLQKIS